MKKEQKMKNEQKHKKSKTCKNTKRAKQKVPRVSVSTLVRGHGTTTARASSFHTSDVKKSRQNSGGRLLLNVNTSEYII